MLSGGVDLRVLWEVNSSSVHKETFPCQVEDWNKKIHRRRINNSRVVEKDLKRSKNTTTFCFSLNCFVYPGEGNTIEPFCLFRSTGSKNTASSLVTCVGRGSSVAPFAPQPGLLSQYRAQTTLALSQQLETVSTMPLSMGLGRTPST